ncbi:MAG: alpha/beta hydrolase [bacterium]|nr:alpha/beta hydrolase [bacterium]
MSTSPIAPTPLSPAQRLRVFLLRAVIALLKLITSFRKKPAPSSITQHRYGDHRAQILEVIPGKAGSPERAPIVYVHGGGWIAGKKELYTDDLYFLAEQGHPVFNLEYPLAPESPHPGILRSLLLALEWIREHHPEVTHAHFMGDSAGGNLVTMLGLLSHNPELIRDIDANAQSRTAVSCISIISIYGVLDRLSWIRNGFPLSGAMLEAYGGKAAFEEQVGPELAITPMDLKFDAVPPIYLCAGTKDELCDSTRILAERVEENGNEVQLEIFDGERHGFFNLTWRPASQEIRRQILAFAERHQPKPAGVQ